MNQRTDLGNRDWLIGPAHGAEHLLILRSAYDEGFFVGLHKHDGEEAFIVLSGRVRFTRDGVHRECGPGEAAVAPTGSEHGFLVIEDAEMLIIREQRLGTTTIVIEPDGTRREVETFHSGPPWAKDPPPGVERIPGETIQEYYATTKHLL
jgi:quercetin dioxygenase-like cupin family protein